MKKKYLFEPGPTPLPEEVALAMAVPMVHHRKSEFNKIFRATAESAKYLFQTKQDILIFAATATVGDIL